MHPTAEAIIAEIDPSDFESVARSVTGDSSASVTGEPRWTEIDETHGDLRTLAILRVEGEALVGGEQVRWSSVQKLIDTTADGGPGNAGGWVDPAREETVYERGLFKDDGSKFRPAACYLITQPRPGMKMFWLEDLTEADRAPFSVEQLHRIIRDLGEFNGFHASRGTDERIETSTDSYLLRWNGSNHARGIDWTAEHADHPILKRLLGTTPMDTVRDLCEALSRLNERSLKLRHGLSFGDSNIGNLFRLGEETVAVDWATVTMDPIGVDAGCLVGSAIARGRGGNAVMEAEKELFSSYVAGLRSGGWTGEEAHVRQAFFGQFGSYLINPVSGAHIVLRDTPEARRWHPWMEKRYETPFDEIPDLLAPRVASYPGYIEEIEALLG